MSERKQTDLWMHIIRLVGAVILLGLGTFLLLNEHPTAGGWTLFFGLIAIGYAGHRDTEEPTDA